MRKPPFVFFPIPLFAAWLLLAAHFAAPARAGLMAPLSLEQLTTKSQLILHGTVASQTVQRDAAGRIYTRVELQIADVWKGALATNRFTIVHGGGVLGEQRAVVSGQAEFALGEEVVAFLVLNDRGEGVVLGLAQGKFNVWQDKKTGERHVRSIFHGTAPASTSTTQPPPKTATNASAPPANAPLTLATLKQRVQGGAK